MKNQNNIEAIVKGCINNNQSCQTKLFNLFYGRMLRTSLQYTKDLQHAKDIVQVSFIKIFKHIHKHNPSKSLEGWIHNIVKNTAIDEIRKAKTKPQSVDINVVNLKVEDKKYDETKLNIILDSINELSPAYKKIFELHLIEERPHKEIAEMLGICEGASKSSLFKAKANMRKIIEKKFRLLGE